MSRKITTTLIAAFALGAAAFAVEPAFAMPMASPVTLQSATAASANVEQVFFVRRGYRRPFFRRGFGYRRGYGYRGGYGYRRGLPGHPIRRILRAL